MVLNAFKIVSLNQLIKIKLLENVNLVMPNVGIALGLLHFNALFVKEVILILLFLKILVLLLVLILMSPNSILV